MPVRQPRVFTIPSGAPFLPTLSHALLDGALIDGFPGSGGAMALADATIYVPTQRAAEALAEALLVASGEREPYPAAHRAARRLRAGRGGDRLRRRERRGSAAPRPAAAPSANLARRHVLATMTRAWGKALGGAIRTVDGDGRLIVDPAEPALVATTPAQAYALAGDLAALIDDMIIEGAPWAKIETLAPDAYDPYWRITLDFLKIAFAHWPLWLAERGLIDRATRIALLIDDEIKALEGGARRGPTIIAGSTGANRATARLIAAIARAPQGAVVLPGLDLDLDDGAWAHDRRERRGFARARGPSPVAHAPADRRDRRQPRRRQAARPRRALARACGALGVPDRSAAARRVDRALARPRTARLRRRPSPLRSQALRSSSPTTKPRRRWRWRSRCAKPWKRRARPRPSSRPIRRSRAGWRRSSRDGASRSRIRPGGRSGRAPRARSRGSFLTPRSSSRRARFSRSSPIPAARFGRARAEAERATRALELAIFRAIPLKSLDDLDRAFGAARDAATDRHAHPAVRASASMTGRRPRRWRAMSPRALAPLRALQPSASLSDCLAAASRSGPAGRRSAARRGADAGEDLRGLEPLSELMDEWSEAAAESFPTALAEYAALFDEALAGGRARRRPNGGHPRLQILGLLEARLLELRSRAAGGPRRNGLAAGGRDRRLPQPADARRARPLGAGAAHRPDGA